MKRFPKVLAAACAAVALSSSLALAAEPAHHAVPANEHAVHAGHGAYGFMGPMMGPLSQLSPEKQEIARKLMFEHAKVMFPLHQSLYAKYAALEAVNAAGDGTGSKAQAAIRDIADIQSRMLTEDSAFRASMFKETGLRMPVMGHHGMFGFGGGMMGGGCGGMGGAMMGGHGPMAPVPAPVPAPAK